MTLTFLSWDSSRQARLLRASRTAGFPFIDMASGVHSRAALRPRFGEEGATPSARSALVVLHHLGGFLLRSFAGLLRPAADPGVHRVSVVSDFPATSIRTPRRMILACSRTTSPWPTPQSSLGFFAPLLALEEVLSFLGLFPFKVLRHRCDQSGRATPSEEVVAGTEPAGIPPRVRGDGRPKPLTVALPESVRSRSSRLPKQTPTFLGFLTSKIARELSSRSVTGRPGHLSSFNAGTVPTPSHGRTPIF